MIANSLCDIFRILLVVGALTGAVKLSAGEVPVDMPSYRMSSGQGEFASDKSPVSDGKSPVYFDGKYVTEGEVLPVSKYKVDVFLGLSYVYDSNTTQLPNGQGSSLGVVDFGFDFSKGSESGRGSFYGFNYTGNAFFYEDSALQAGRDNLNHRFGGDFGINGAKTKFRFSTDYFHNSGNSLDFADFDREVRAAESDDYSFAFSAVRQLPHGSIEVGTGYSLRDFEAGTLLNDGSGYYGDFAWFYRPGFAPRSSFGVGVNAGRDNFDRNGDQDYVTPSFRWRYRLSGKTNLYGSAGQEFRSTNGPGGRDSENFVYRTGVTWAASSKTTLDLSSYRNVSPSYVTGGEDYRTTGVILVMSQQLPGNFSLSTSAGYESADYFQTGIGGIPSGRQDDYFRLGVNLGHPLRITDHLAGDVSVFYNYNENSSNSNLVEFDQHVTGVRMGVTY